MSPGYISNKNPKYMEIDGFYYSGLIIIDYNREYHDIILKNLINTNVNMNISIFYEKQDSYKTIKELTYFIGNVGVNLNEGNTNREDIDIAAYSYNDAKYIRKEMQVNNDDLYFLYTYINIVSNNERELFRNINKIEGLLQANGLMTKKANFRQEQIFLSTIPMMNNNNDIRNVSKRNILGNSLVSTYPFSKFIGCHFFNN